MLHNMGRNCNGCSIVPVTCPPKKLKQLYLFVTSISKKLQRIHHSRYLPSQKIEMVTLLPLFGFFKRCNGYIVLVSVLQKRLLAF
jgi:hypothetical protein